MGLAFCLAASPMSRGLDKESLAAINERTRGGGSNRPGPLSASGVWAINKSIAKRQSFL